MSPRLSRAGQDEAVYTLLDAAPSPVVAVDADGVIDYLNLRAAAALGYPPEELLGEGVEILVPEDLHDLHHRFREAYAGRPVARSVGMDQPVQVRRRDGTEFPAEISLMPLQTSGSLWVVTTIYDVTLREEREQRVQALNRSYLALAQLNEAIVRAPDELELFAATCRIAVEQGGYLGAWVAARGPGESVVVAARAGSLNDYIDRLEVSTDPHDPRSRGATGLAFCESAIHYSTDVPRVANSPWRELDAAYDVRAAVAVPLLQGGRTTAVLTMYSDRLDIFDEQMRAVLPGAAEDLSYALDAFDKSARLVQVARERAELSARLVDAQEEERARIAADVHDDSVQALAAVRLRMTLLRKKLEVAAPELTPAVEELQQTVSAVGDGLRDLLFELESSDARRTLTDLVEEAAHHVFDHTAVVPVVRLGPLSPDAASLSEPVRRQAMRIVKEALVNAREHSGAEHVEVVIAYQATGAEVAVSDDGVGFEPETIPNVPGHRGLTTMQDRAAVVGGWCRLERGERGMTVRFWVPYAGTVPAREMAPRY